MSTRTKYYVDKAGNYLGGWNGKCSVSGAIEVESPPDHADQKWDGSMFLPAVRPAHEQMADLELTRTPRREREARIGVAGAQKWLDDLDVKIEALRP